MCVHAPCFFTLVALTLYCVQSTSNSSQRVGLCIITLHSHSLAFINHLLRPHSFFMKDPVGKFLSIIFTVFPWSMLVKGFNDLGMAINEDGRGELASQRLIFI